MAYKVRLTQPAEADAYAAYEYIRDLAPFSAEPWLIGLFQAIETLSDFPARCPVIPEATELAYDARQLLYGKRTGTYVSVKSRPPVLPSLFNG